MQNKLPVFRTESQRVLILVDGIVLLSLSLHLRNHLWDIVCKRDRMLASGANFALGFFGWPLHGKYEQVTTIEASGVGFDFFVEDVLSEPSSYGRTTARSRSTTSCTSTRRTMSSSSLVGCVLVCDSFARTGS